MPTIFTDICTQLELGDLVSEPVQLTGGLTHKMYRIDTSRGNFAIKLLNPYIMKRESAKANFKHAEAFEIILEHHMIPILPARTFHKTKMQQLNGQFYYIFDWYDGVALSGKQIKKFHCEEMGKVLARIHNIDRKIQKYEREEIHIDWEFYIHRLKEENKEIYQLVKEHLPLLIESQTRGNKALGKLPEVVTICHNDMDSKNVLWSGKEYRIIDLECLSYASPLIELYEMALCWSGYEQCNIDFELFHAFINAYTKAGGMKVDNWEVLYDSNYGRLEWLEYNLKRVLGIDCTAEEKEIGIAEVMSTMAHIVYYAKIKSKVLL